MDTADIRERILKGTTPRDLAVPGDLNLQDCASLTTLLEGLSVEEFLDLRGCTSLTRLARAPSVGGHLYL